MTNGNSQTIKNIFKGFVVVAIVLSVLTLVVCISIVLFGQAESNTSTQRNVSNASDYKLTTITNPVDIRVYNVNGEVKLHNTTINGTSTTPFYIEFINTKRNDNLLDLSSRSINADVTLHAPDNVVIFTTDSNISGLGDLSEHFRIPTDNDHIVTFSTKTNKEGNYTVTTDIKYWYGDDSNTSETAHFTNTVSTSSTF